LLIAGLGIFLSMAPALAQQPPTIKIPVRLVTVPTLVFSAQGDLITGLERKDFKLYDNNRSQSFRLDAEQPQYSIAVLVQASESVRAYLPFINKAASTLENSLQGETGELAVLGYEDDVTVLKPFGSGDVEDSIHHIAAGGEKARMLDAGMRSMRLLSERPASRSRILLIIGQPFDSGSSATLADLAETAEREGVSVFTLALPMFGKKFISDTLSLRGLTSQKGGFMASVELTKLGPALKHRIKQNSRADPFSLLTGHTGGMTIHFRKQNELENALIALGGALRATYVLSYSPDPATSGQHTISVKVDIPGALTHARPGYQLGPI
jgi:VWFA-related protein